MSSDLTKKAGGYPDNIRHVRSYNDLMTHAFSRDHNVILMPRALQGDFDAVARQMLEIFKPRDKRLAFGWPGAQKWDGEITPAGGNRPLSAFQWGINSWLSKTHVSEQAVKALTQVCDDIRRLHSNGYDVQLRIQKQNRMMRPHIDGFRERILTNYCGAPTMVWEPEVCAYTRNRRGRLSGAVISDAAGFAVPLGDIWRQACESIEEPVLPAVHADIQKVIDTPRMLLVAQPRPQ